MGDVNPIVYFSSIFLNIKIAFKIAAFYDYDTLTSKCQCDTKIEEASKAEAEAEEEHDTSWHSNSLVRIIYLDLNVFSSPFGIWMVEDRS